MKADQPRKGRAFPLQIVLVVPFVLQIFGAVGLVGYLSFRNGQKAVNDLAEQLIDKASQQIDEHLDSYLAIPIQLTEMSLQAIATGDLDIQNPRANERYFWRQSKAFPNIAYIGYVLTDGREVGAGRWITGLDVLLYENLPEKNKASDYLADAQGNRSRLIQTYESDATESSWYQETVAAGKLTWTRTYVLETTIPELSEAGEALQTQQNLNLEDANIPYVAVSASAPFYNKQGKLLGIIGVDLLVSQISEFLKTLRVSPNGQVFVIERNGFLIGSSTNYPILYKNNDGEIERHTASNTPDPLLQAVNQAIQQQFNHLQNIQSTQELEVEFNGQRQFVRVMPWRDAYGLDWLVMMVMPEADFMGQINANTHTTVLLCFGALFFASVMGVFTSRWIARPILRLSRASEAMASGNLDQTVETSGIRELNTLSGSFNHMAKRLSELFTASEKGKEELEDRVEERTAELKHALAELQRTQAQIVQSEKMSSLGQLVAGVAHEINNPVNFIHGNLTHVQAYTEDLLEFVQLYQQHNFFPPEIQTAAEEIDLEFLQEDLPRVLASMKLGTDRIRQIILSLRNFSRMDEAEYKAVDIHEGIDSTLLILQHRLKARAERPEIEIIKDYAALPLVECYAGQLNQVFMNILVNAIDAIEDHNANRNYQEIKDDPGRITIRTSVVKSAWVEVAIVDNGSGIPQEIQQRIFDPFFTTKPLGKGTGMGMSISYQIITEKHGGKLDCFSTPGKGTEFIIQIPLQQQVHQIIEQVL